MLGDAFTEVLGLELYHGGETQYSARYVVLERKGNELEIKSRKVFVGNLAKILETLPKNQPIAMVLSGKGIVHKRISMAEEVDDKVRIFRQAFPSIEANDFFIQQYANGNDFFLSIARREMVVDLLEKFRRAGVEIYRFSLGGLVAAHILPQLNVYGETLQFDGHQFTTLNKLFVAYRYESGLQSAFPIKIAEEQIVEELIVAYASAFQLLLQQQLPAIIAEVEEVNDRYDRFLGNSRWKKKGLVFLFLLFVLLLLSFSLFTHYNQQNEKLLREVGAQVASADQVDLLKQHIAKQEQLLKQLGWNGGYNYGFLVNEIGNNMPRPLTLASIALNDFKTEREKQERVPNIRIKGNTDNLTAVNNWIFVLREKPWVKSAKLLKFQEEPEGEHYQFEIIMTY